VCFSGGGIRSATFNLGVLQTLAEIGLLEQVDYLSTVSGGGYIHQWLAAWLRRAAKNEANPNNAFETVNTALVAHPRSVLPGTEPTQISFLRRFSNYLTPEKGVFSADTWTLIAIWMRNTFLNQLVLITGLVMILSTLRLVLAQFHEVTPLFREDGPHRSEWQLPLEAYAGGLVILACAFICWRIRRFAKRLDTGLGDTSFFSGDIPIVATTWALLFAAALHTASSLDLNLSPALSAVFISWPMLLSWWAFIPRLYRKVHSGKGSWWARIWSNISAVPAGLMVFLVLSWGYQEIVHKFPDLWQKYFCSSQNKFLMALVQYACVHPLLGRDLVLLVVPPMLVAGLFLTCVLHIGLNRQVFRDEMLEWMARFRAWAFLTGMTWFGGAGCLILSGPLISAGVAVSWLPILSAIWGAISGGGAFAARSKSVSGAGSKNPSVNTAALGALAQIAPYVFILGLLIAASYTVTKISERYVITETGVDGSYVDSFPNILILLAVSAAIFIVYGFTVDINEFSMHSFYRNRLARCYQGASVKDRKPDAFTGFSKDDRAVRLGDLRLFEHQGQTRDVPPEFHGYPGPIPIFCCTVNFTAGEDLAWQERKGASFAFSPWYSGYDVPWTGLDRDDDKDLYYNGYRDTLDLAHPKGPALADVCATSGAAISPNWGYHTTPATAFLMTCFNVRLGVWRRNTRRPMRGAEERRMRMSSFDDASPRFAPIQLGEELLGQVNARSKYLYLTDGGHFDNMGLYELVRRKCRYIIVCDAEEDKAITFEGIGMALRKCRTDFGVEIDLDLRALRKAAETGWSSVHCVVGTILYPTEDPDTLRRDRGKIVYLKSTMTGSEPADLLSYKLEHSAFPHDSTVNQWFSESQFESYRVLGRDIALTALKPACETMAREKLQPIDREEFFDTCYDIWYPVMPVIEQHLDKHVSKLDDLIRELRSNDQRLKHVDLLFKNGQTTPPLHSDEDKVYLQALALSLFDFMWQVYNDLDLQLASNRAHPQADIWMRTFEKWTEMPFIKQAWPTYLHRYPEGFHFFMKEHLGLKKT
jgi:hypothetical protein